MGIISNVHWCDSAANPTSGCEGCELWVRSQGIFICYSGRKTEQLKGRHPGFSPKFEMVIPRAGRMRKAALWPDLLGDDRSDLKTPKPWLAGLPRIIFVSDMADALSEGITFEFLEAEIIDNVISPEGRRHSWLWLTKQPKKLVLFWIWLWRRGRAWPENLWAGTSVTSQATVGRVADILKVGDERTRHFLSLEPQQGPVDLGDDLARLDWLIHGGQSAPTKKDRDATPAFDLAWVRTIKTACAKAGVAYFLKQAGAHVLDGGKRLVLKDASHGGESEEWPADLRSPDVRQMPRVTMLAGVQRGAHLNHGGSTQAPAAGEADHV